GEGAVVAGDGVGAPDGRGEDAGAEPGGPAPFELADDRAAAGDAVEFAERADLVLAFEVVERHREERDVERAVRVWETERVRAFHADLRVVGGPASCDLEGRGVEVRGGDVDLPALAPGEADDGAGEVRGPGADVEDGGGVGGWEEGGEVAEEGAGPAEPAVDGGD